jgi:hypothetical protein
MTNPARLVDEEKLKKIFRTEVGLGTQATRANIIETLIKRGYVKRSGKNLIAVDKGINKTLRNRMRNMFYLFKLPYVPLVLKLREFITNNIHQLIITIKSDNKKAYPSITPERTGLSYPTQLIRINAKINARIKLKKGPANTTLIRPHTGFLPNARLSVESSSSPSIMQAPPNGNALMQYLVSPFCIPQIVGPRPKQNSFTRIPFAFARRKCPSS